jgi:hypothetical protein
MEFLEYENPLFVERPKVRTPDIAPQEAANQAKGGRGGL